MNRNRRRTQRVDGESQPKFWSAITGLIKNLAAPLVAAVVGAVAFWFEPVRERIQHWIWEERASLELSVHPAELRAGDEIKISVIGRPMGHIAVGEGILRLQLPSQLQLISGASLVPVAAFGEPRELQGQEPILAWAVDEGRVELSAVLETLNGRYEAKRAVTILSPSSAGHATRKNFSGRWNGSLGNDEGYLIIVERPKQRTFSGEYRFGAENGVLEGYRDGKTFRATLFRGNSPMRWRIKAKIPEDLPVESLELKGEGTIQEFQNGEWQALESSVPFEAVPG